MKCSSTAPSSGRQLLPAVVDRERPNNGGASSASAREANAAHAGWPAHSQRGSLRPWRLGAIVGHAVAIITLLGAPAAAWADRPTVQPVALSADEFLARVGRSHPGLERLEGEIDLRQADVTAAGLWTNPTLAYDREEIFAGPRRFPENILRLELPLEISGRRRLRVEAGRLGVRATRQRVARDRKGILLDALGVYLRAASARQRLELLRKERATVARLLEAIRARAAAADASGYDRGRLALEAEALEDELAQAERGLAALRRALGLLAGIPMGSFDASDALTPPASPRVVTQSRRASMESPSRGGSGASVLEARGDIQAAGLRIAQAEKELLAARRGWVPTLSLFAGAKSAAVDDHTRWGYVLGLAISLPFLDYGQAEAARARARLRLARAERRRIAQEAQAQGAIAAEALTLVLAQLRRFAKTRLPSVERLLARAEAAYREGERPVFELLDAYRVARSARLRFLSLRLLARLSELELWRARGQGPGGRP